MSDESQQLEHRERKGSGVWLILSFLLLLMIYVLSPPWAEMAAGPGIYNNHFYQFVYAPLIYLAEQFPSVREFYIWYYGICGMG